MVDTIRYHYAVRKSAHDINLLMIVHVANIIVNSHVSNSKSEPDFSAIYPGAANIMRPQLENVSGWFFDVSREIDSACEFFLEESCWLMLAPNFYPEFLSASIHKYCDVFLRAY